MKFACQDAFYQAQEILSRLKLNETIKNWTIILLYKNYFLINDII